MSTHGVTHHQLLFVNDEGILLSSTEQEVLARMFTEYERLIVKSELGGGFGGGRVLLVRPITAVSADLPAVVKLGRATIIQQEWDAFTHYVQRKVPKVAHIVGEPQFTADSSWGGIRYPLAGDGYFSIESLGTFCRREDDKDILYVLENQLFPSMGALWQGAQPVHEYAFGRSLDAILPVNLVVTYRNLGTSVSAPDWEQQLGVGDEVTLADLFVTETDGVAGELTLDLQPDKTNPAGGWRIRITAVPDVSDYQTGEILPQPITGVVAATRNTIFQTQLARIFDTPISAAASTFTLPETGSLPNPIAHLPTILKQRGDVRVGIVHGDLNLENVLVEFDHKSLNIHLIDFANARRDWILHDLLRLETNVWLHVIPEEMKRHGRSLSDLSHLVASLQTAVAHPNQIEIPSGLAKPFHVLLAIRRQAQHLLMSPHTWDAYWQGLTVYLAGALKFQNLDKSPLARLPKQVAFVTAALLQQGRHGELFKLPLEVGISTSSTTTRPTNLTSLGIRSFLQWSEDLQNQTDSMLSLSHHFSERRIKNPDNWNTEIPNSLRAFIRQNIVRGGSYRLHLITHSSIAFLAGYLLPEKIGIAIEVIQYSGRGTSSWSFVGRQETGSSSWEFIQETCHPGVTENALIIELTLNNIRDGAVGYIRESLPSVGSVTLALPVEGSSPASVRDGAHADELANQLIQYLRSNGIGLGTENRVHIFSAAPNGFIFCLGRKMQSLPYWSLYEYDFGSGIAAAYSPSIANYK